MSSDALSPTKEETKPTAGPEENKTAGEAQLLPTDNEHPVKLTSEGPIASPEPRNAAKDRLAEIIRTSLKENGLTMGQLLEAKMMVGESERGEKQQIVMVNDLLQAVAGLCKAKLSPEQLGELEGFFRSIVECKEDYVLMQDLLTYFGERLSALPDKEPEDVGEIDEGLLAEELTGAEKLDEGSLGLIAKLIRHLQANKLNFFTLFKNFVYKQQIVVEEQEESVDVVEAGNFYKVLKEAGIAEQEDGKLSAFLCIDASYPHILLVKKILKLIEHVAVGMEQEASGEGTRLRHDLSRGSCGTEEGRGVGGGR